MSTKIASLFVEIGGDASGAKKALEQVKSGLGQAKETLGALRGMFGATSIGLGSLASIGVTMKQAFDFGEAGARIDQTADSFALMMEKIGAAPDLLSRLREASRGTISDMDLMSSTMTLTAGVSDELAKSMADAAPQLLEIAKAANKANPELGTTAFMYESLMKGIKRGSPMIIDNTGLILKIGEANEKYAQAIGKTVEQLTAEDKKQALLNATIAAGSNLMRQVGDDTNAQMDAFARLDTTTTNLSNTLKASFAPALADAAEGLNTLLTWHDTISNSFITHEAEVRKTADGYTEYIEEMIRAGEAAGITIKATQSGIEVYQLLGSQLQNVTDKYPILTRAQYYNQLSMQESDDHLSRLADQYRNAADGADSLASSTGNVTASLDTVMSSMREVTEEMLFQKAAADMDAAAALELGRAIGVIDEVSYYALSSLDELRSKYDSNADGAIDAAEAAAGYSDEVARLIDLQERLRDREVTYTVNFEYNGGPGTQDIAAQERNYGIDLNGNGIIGAKNGADFIVPAGHPNDSMLIGVSSGEHVQVTPASANPTAKREADPVRVELMATVNNKIDIEELAYRVAEVIRRRG